MTAHNQTTFVQLPNSLSASTWYPPLAQNAEKLRLSATKTELKSPYSNLASGTLFATAPAELGAIIEDMKKRHEWANASVKERATVLFNFRKLLLESLDEISHLIAAESGKLFNEAKAGLLKGIEVTEFALSLQNLDAGERLEVSRGVFCETRRKPLGIVAGITPFNFPAMVPLWMLPIALACGNSFLWKPSDKTPLTSMKIAELFLKAGLPHGALAVIQGGVEIVNAICDHPDVKAVGFVGSTAVAKAVYTRATAHGKRALCLGGAKNPIVLMPDADVEMAVDGIMQSFTGCAGQRCMAASVLLATEGTDTLIQKIAERASTLELGKTMGAIVTAHSKEFLTTSIAQAEKEGAKVILDGRSKKLISSAPSVYEKGNWLGATVLDHVKPDATAACHELFGPVLSIVRVKNLEEALKFEGSTEYGNAASIFTQNGATAEAFASRAHAGMIGINIGVPVPREPFSFGGFHSSRFGSGDITGLQGVDFWSQTQKITTKWAMPTLKTWMS